MARKIKYPEFMPKDYPRLNPPEEKITCKLFKGKYVYSISLRKEPYAFVSAHLKAILEPYEGEYKLENSSAQERYNLYTNNRDLFMKLMTEQEIFVYTFSWPTNEAHKKLLLSNNNVDKNQVVRKELYHGRYKFMVYLRTKVNRSKMEEVLGHEEFRSNNTQNGTMVYVNTYDEAIVVRMLASDGKITEAVIL